MTDDGPQVWVVDDDRAVRFVLAAALSEAGYEVSAFDGAAAARFTAYLAQVLGDMRRVLL